MKFNFCNFRLNVDVNGSVLVDVNWVESSENFYADGCIYDFPFQYHEKNRGAAKLEMDAEALDMVVKLASCSEDGKDDSAELSKKLETQLIRAYKLVLEVKL